MPLIEMGKKYRTRAGKAARVLATDILMNSGPVIAAISEGGQEAVLRFTADGHYCYWTTQSPQDHPYDLIEVKPEVKGWINVYRKPSFYNPNATYNLGCLGNGIFDTKEKAESYQALYREPLACIPVSFREGEGLEENAK